MLTNEQKRSLDAILQDFSTLEHILMDLEKKEAVLHFMIDPDCDEHGDFGPRGESTWNQDRNFRLKGVKSVAIDPGKEELIPELSSVQVPSTEFFLFAVSLFDRQINQEWRFFPDPPDRPPELRPDLTRPPNPPVARQPRWVYVLDPNTTGQEDYMEFFKVRGGVRLGEQRSAWTLLICFTEFEIVDSDPDWNPLPPEEFFKLYPLRVNRWNR